MFKSFACLALVILVSSCSRSYKVETSNNVPVVFSFKSNDKNVITTWRKINSDGSRGQQFTVPKCGLFSCNFKDVVPTEVILDAGVTYYLEEFQIQYKDNDKNIIKSNSNKVPDIMSKKTNEKTNPKYLSFTVKKGSSKLRLPKVTIIAEDLGIRGKSFKFVFDDPNHIFVVGEHVKEGFILN